MARFLVTSALPYANGSLHLGHLAGAYLPADIFVRSRKLCGDDVVFVSGTDEYGVPITIRAEQENLKPQDIVNRYHNDIKDTLQQFSISFDNFSGTSRKAHHTLAQDFFLNLEKNDFLMVKEEGHFYDEQSEKFLPDRYVEGTCPKCGDERARGDQCDMCGTLLTPFQLLNPRSALTGSKPVVKKDTHWYLKLQDFERYLEEWITNQTFWKDNVRNFVLGWLHTEGLHERAITRNMKWGVPVPLDSAEAEGKVLYVWFDAPIGYISATKEWAEQQGNPDLWKQYWKNPETKLIHFIGKDNILFHTIIWPSLLKGQNSDWIRPYDVPSNEYLTLEGEKFSTSQNWAVWAKDVAVDFNIDSVRYVLASNAPESKDADFSWNLFQLRTNELANVYGNFVNRVCIFVSRLGGLVPSASYLDEDKKYLEHINVLLDNVFESFKNYRVRDACRLMMEMAREGNRYFDGMQPWVLQKTDQKRMNTVLNVCLNTLRVLAFASYSVIPETASKLWNALGYSTKLEDEVFDSFKENILPIAQKVSDPGVLVRKIEDCEIENQLKKLNQQAGRKQVVDMPKKESKSLISIEDVTKLDLRVAEIITAEVPPKSKKLVKLRVKIDKEERQIMAGIKEFYSPQELIGKKIVIVYNLKPAQLAGELSEGMLLAASTHDKSVISLLDPGDVPDGTSVG